LAWLYATKNECVSIFPIPGSQAGRPGKSAHIFLRLLLIKPLGNKSHEKQTLFICCESEPNQTKPAKGANPQPAQQKTQKNSIELLLFLGRGWTLDTSDHMMCVIEM